MTLEAVSLDDLVNAVRDGFLTPEEALMRLDISQLKPTFQLAEGEAAPTAWPDIFGAFVGPPCSGYLAFTQEQVDQLHAAGKPIILVISEVYSLTEFKNDIRHRIQGLLIPGDGFSHAKIWLEGLNISAAAGLRMGLLSSISSERGGALIIDRRRPDKSIDSQILGHAFEPVTLWPPHIYKGVFPLTKFQKFYEQIERVASWVDDIKGEKHLKLLANVDTSAQVLKPIIKKTDGIGLIRTEEILTRSYPSFSRFFKLLGLQKISNSSWQSLQFAMKTGFRQIIENIDDKTTFPITVRLPDLQLHELLSPEDYKPFSKIFSDSVVRGVQLAQRFPHLYEAQAEAIFESIHRTEFSSPLSIMVPTVRTAAEVLWAKDLVQSVAERYDMQGRYQFRSMIETEEAAENIRSIAPLVQGISIGTNDLTSEILKLPRGNKEALEKWKAENGGIDPFVTLHPKVLEKIKKIIKEAREVNPAIDISICGHHATDPAAIAEFCRLGINSLSVPPTEHHLHMTRIAATQAILKMDGEAVQPRHQEKPSPP